MKIIAGILATVVVAPILFVVLIVAPQGGALCTSDEPFRVVQADVDGFSPSQQGVAQAILESVDSDPTIGTIAIMVAITATNLKEFTNDGHGQYRIDPFTGEPTGLSIADAAKAQGFYLIYQGTVTDAGQELELGGTIFDSPVDLAAELTGWPPHALEEHWAAAASLAVHLTGQESAGLGVTDGTEGVCSELLMIAWDAGEVVIEGGWAHPLAAPLVISSPFGYRHDPTTGEYKLHAGTDYKAECGTPIVAAADGIVVDSRESAGYGNIIAIAHDNGYVTRYAHMETEDRFVNGADSVVRGQVIAVVGNAGHSTGCHLHFEVYLPDGRLANSQQVLGF